MGRLADAIRVERDGLLVGAPKRLLARVELSELDRQREPTPAAETMTEKRLAEIEEWCVPRSEYGTPGGRYSCLMSVDLIAEVRWLRAEAERVEISWGEAIKDSHGRAKIAKEKIKTAEGHAERLLESQRETETRAKEWEEAAHKAEDRASVAERKVSLAIGNISAARKTLDNTIQGLEYGDDA